MEQETPQQTSKYIPTDADYEKAEMDQLRDALKRTHTERFLIMTRLMKMNIMFRNAKIIRTPYTLYKNFRMNETTTNTENINELNEDKAPYMGFVHKSEDEKLREDVFRSPIEKLHLFTRMLRREAVLKRAKIVKP